MERTTTDFRDRGDALFLASFRLVGLAAAVVFSFAAALGIPYLFRLGPRVSQLLASPYAIFLPVCLLVGSVVVSYLIKYAEVAVSMFYLVGFFKGDPRLDSFPVDLTIVIAVIMVMAMTTRLVFSEQTLKLPLAFLFYFPILILMFCSLLYTPNFSAGLDKTLRFLLLTCFGALSPFLLVDTPLRIKRFLFGLVAGGVLMSINSLFMLGGEDRLVSPSGVTISLGLSAGLAVAIIWSFYFPTMSFLQRLAVYPIVGVLLIALIGSGARLANVGTAACVAMAVFLHRKLLVDLGLTLVLGALALPFVRIPAASLDYLASLIHPHTAFGTRSDLMDLGLRTFLAHPLFGVGVQGYRFVSPNPITYNFAHNLVLEIGSELGIFALLAFVALIVSSFRVMFRLLRDTSSPDILLYRAVFCVLILPTLDICVAGDMNNDKLAWFMFSMPFVLQAYAVSTPRRMSLAQADRQPQRREFRRLETAFLK